jgi:hypothetical protein
VVDPPLGSALARSIATYMSAALCLTAWKEPIGAPNWTRCFTCDDQVQDAAATPDRGDRQAHQRQVRDPWNQVRRGHMSHVQGRVEGGDPFRVHLRAADHHHATVGDQRDLIGPVGIKNEPA